MSIALQNTYNEYKTWNICRYLLYTFINYHTKFDENASLYGDNIMLSFINQSILDKVFKTVMDMDLTVMSQKEKIFFIQQLYSDYINIMVNNINNARNYVSILKDYATNPTTTFSQKMYLQYIKYIICYYRDYNFDEYDMKFVTNDQSSSDDILVVKLFLIHKINKKTIEYDVVRITVNTDKDPKTINKRDNFYNIVNNQLMERINEINNTNITDDNKFIIETSMKKIYFFINMYINNYLQPSKIVSDELKLLDTRQSFITNIKYIIDQLNQYIENNNAKFTTIERLGNNTFNLLTDRKSGKKYIEKIDIEKNTSRFLGGLTQAKLTFYKYVNNSTQNILGSKLFNHIYSVYYGENKSLIVDNKLKNTLNKYEQDLREMDSKIGQVIKSFTSNYYTKLNDYIYEILYGSNTESNLNKKKILIMDNQNIKSTVLSLSEKYNNDLFDNTTEGRYIYVFRFENYILTGVSGTYSNLKKGDIMIIPTSYSTTVNTGTSNLGGFADKPIILRIRLDKYSKFAILCRYSTHYAEKEILLPYGSKLHVDNVIHIYNGDIEKEQIIIELTYIDCVNIVELSEFLDYYRNNYLNKDSSIIFDTKINLTSNLITSNLTTSNLTNIVLQSVAENIDALPILKEVNIQNPYSMIDNTYKIAKLPSFLSPNAYVGEDLTGDMTAFCKIEKLKLSSLLNEKSLNILSFNVHNFVKICQVPGRNICHFENFLKELLAKTHVDIISLQEVAPIYEEEPKTQDDIINKGSYVKLVDIMNSLGFIYYSIVNTTHNVDEHGVTKDNYYLLANAIFSKHMSINKISYGLSGNRCVQVFDFYYNSVHYSYINTHLEWQTDIKSIKGNNSSKKLIEVQISQLYNILNKHRRFILTGDFNNDIYGDELFLPITQNSTLAFEKLPSTYTGFNNKNFIDYILISNTITHEFGFLKNVEKQNNPLITSASDHYPVFASILPTFELTQIGINAVTHNHNTLVLFDNLLKYKIDVNIHLGKNTDDYDNLPDLYLYNDFCVTCPTYLFVVAPHDYNDSGNYHISDNYHSNNHNNTKNTGPTTVYPVYNINNNNSNNVKKASKDNNSFSNNNHSNNNIHGMKEINDIISKGYNSNNSNNNPNIKKFYDFISKYDGNVKKNNNHFNSNKNNNNNNINNNNDSNSYPQYGYGMGGALAIDNDNNLDKLIKVLDDHPNCIFNVTINNDIFNGVYTYLTNNLKSAKLIKNAKLILNQDNSTNIIESNEQSNIEFIKSFGSSGVGKNEFKFPLGVAITQTAPLLGLIVVADSANHRIKVYTPKGVNIYTFGKYGKNDGEFNEPIGVAINKEGYIIVTDSLNNRVQIFDRDFKFVRKFGIKGQGAVEFEMPTGVAVSKNNEIVVIDYFNKRLQIFDINGVFIRKIDVNEFMSAITINNDNDYIYVAGTLGAVSEPDETNNVIYMYAMNGGYVGIFAEGAITFNNPSGITIDNNKNIILITESGNNTVQILTLDGNFIIKFGAKGQDDSGFDYPAGITIGLDGDIIIADKYNDRIQIFRLHLLETPPNITNVSNVSNASNTSNKSLLLEYANKHDNKATDKPTNKVGPAYNAIKFIKTFGSLGSEYGEFKQPSGVAVNSHGNIIVSDTENHRIQVFTSNGIFLFEFGSFGSNNGQFDGPSGVAVSKENNIIVSDLGNYRIQIFDQYGAFIRKFGSKGHGDDQFDLPIALAVSADNYIIVGDHYNGTIQVFESTGTLVRKFKLDYDILAIAINHNNNVLITVVQSNEIYEVNLEGKMIKVIDTSEQNIVELSGIAVTNDNNIVITDGENNNILILDYNGTLITKVGSKGVANGEFNTILGVTVDALYNNNSIIVADKDNNRIQIFKPVLLELEVDNITNNTNKTNSNITNNTKNNTNIPKIQHIKTFGSVGDGVGEFKSPTNVATSLLGYIIVADTMNDRVQVFMSNGTFVYAFGTHGKNDGEFDGPLAVAVSKEGNIIVSDEGNYRIQIFDQYGTFIRKFGSRGHKGDSEFDTPISLAVSKDNYIVVADHTYNMIKIFEPNGTFIRKFAIENPILAIAINKDDNIFITDTVTHGILIYSMGGKLINIIGKDTEFNDPSGIAISRDTNTIVVTDLGNNDVKIFSPDGNLITKFNLNGPFGVAFGLNGDIIIVDKYSRVHIFKPELLESESELKLESEIYNTNNNTNNNTKNNTNIPKIQHISTFGSSGGKNGDFYYPEGVAINKDGVIVIADTFNDRVQIFDPYYDEFTVTTFGSQGDKNGEFRRVTKVAIDPNNNNIVVADTGNNRVQIFSPDGTFITTFGQNDLEFFNPTGLAVDKNSNIVIVNGNNNEVRTFSSDGNFIKKFNLSILMISPNDITINRDGNFIISDTENKKINIFDPTGILIHNFGTEGWEAHEFKSPTYVTTDLNNNIIVTDVEQNQIKIFDPLGTFITALGTYGSKDGQFDSPTGVAVSNDGKLVVVDGFNNRFQIFISDLFIVSDNNNSNNANNNTNTNDNNTKTNANNTKTNATNTNTKTNTPIKIDAEYLSTIKLDNGIPVGIAINPQNNNIVITDALNHQVNIYNINGDLVSQFGTRGVMPSKFISPKGITISKNGDIFVVDSQNHRIQIFGSDNKFIREIGNMGTKNGQFVNPSDVVITSYPNEYIIVSDTDNNRVQIFDMNGAFILTFGSGHLDSPSGLAIDNNNRIIIADTMNNQIKIYNINGEFISAFGSDGNKDGQFNYPSSVAVSPGGNYIVVIDSGNNRVQIFTSDGTFVDKFGSTGNNNGQFRSPQYIAFFPDGNRVAITDSNNRIQIFRLYKK